MLDLNEFIYPIAIGAERLFHHAVVAPTAYQVTRHTVVPNHMVESDPDKLVREEVSVVKFGYGFAKCMLGVTGIALSFLPQLEGVSSIVRPVGFSLGAGGLLDFATNLKGASGFVHEWSDCIRESGKLAGTLGFAAESAINTLFNLRVKLS